MRHHLRRLAGIALVIVSCATAAAADLEIKAGDGSAWRFHCPDGVQATKNDPPEGIPPTIKAKGAGMSLQITFMPPGRPALDTQAAVDDLVAKIGAGQFEGGSLEKKTTVTRLTVAGGLGAIARYTDADLVDVAVPRPGQYKVVATGIIVLGRNAAAVTLLGDAFDAPGFTQGVALLEAGFTAK
jgi:hypothetical protein